MIQRNNRRGGFTLIELILAMSVGAMLALSLYTAMHVAQIARRSALAAVEPTRAVTIAADLVRQDFESVLPPTGIFAGAFIGLHQPALGGDQDSVQFYAIGADDVPQDVPMNEGIRQVELLVRGDVTPPVLVRRVTRNLLPSIDASVQEEIICRDVRSFTLRYFDGTSWQENWDSTLVDNVLPVAVGITLEIGDEQPVQTNALQTTATPRRVSRIIPLACGKPMSTDAMGVVP